MVRRWSEDHYALTYTLLVRSITVDYVCTRLRPMLSLCFGAKRHRAAFVEQVGIRIRTNGNQGYGRSWRSRWLEHGVRPLSEENQGWNTYIAGLDAPFRWPSNNSLNGIHLYISSAFSSVVFGQLPAYYLRHSKG